MEKPVTHQLGEENLQLLRSQAHRLRLEGGTWTEITLIVGMSLGAVV
jgi:hypothetical protein